MLGNLPDLEQFCCTIKTPEFKNEIIWKWKKQSGVFDKDKLIFTPHSNIFSGYPVQFRSIEDFEKSVISYD